MKTHTSRRDDHRPPGHLVVIGSGPREEWEHAMGRLAEGGPLLLIDEKPPSWQRRYIAGCRTANLANLHEVREAARKLSIEHHLAGVLTFHPAHARAAALVRQDFNLPGPSPATLETTTMRHRTADILARAGVASSGALHADSYNEALEAAHRFGFPVVCKPASPRKRYAARLVDSLPALAAAFSSATATTWPGTGTVIEPWIAGIEATAYTLGTPSRTRLVAVSHATFDPVAEPALLPLEVVIDADDLCAPGIEDIACLSLAAIGHQSGLAQIRLRITATGPLVISVTTHLTDPLLGALIHQVTGIDLIAASGNYARGCPTETEGYRLGATAVRFLQVAQSSDVRSVHVPACRNVTPYAHLEHYAAPRPVGPVRRSGHLQASGTDYQQCVARLQTAVGELRAS
ncbi:hypothetical protein ACFU5O_31990 [Streptomyces sp. NPDC057445]|uniref:hypothetical protein n=1 Tax=Streptomyces sp. NPDC057445 TaxID=3346136 RepID=UPI0036A05392